MGRSLRERVEGARARERKRILRALPLQLLNEIAVRAVPPWWWEGRPEQFEPRGVLRWWLILAGRGWGKTRTGAEWIAEKARRHPGARCALIAVTFTDGRDTMVEGDSGLLSVLDPSELRGGTVDTAWNRSLGELVMANGSRFKIFSSERPRQLRGPQHHFLWGDEPAYWADADRGTGRDTTWSNANFGLRLPARKDWPNAATFKPQAVLTTTPRPVPLLKVPDEIAKEKPHEAGLLQRPASVTVTRGRTVENLDNLSKEYRQEVIDPLIGTSLGRQELDAELLEQVDGALWMYEWLADNRVSDAPPLAKSAVAFDPSGGAGSTHDEHGVIVAGLTGARQRTEFYVTADYSMNGTPADAARRVLLAWGEHECDAIVYEKNQGQDWIPTVIQQAYEKMVADGDWPYQVRPLPLQGVSATKGKKLRAQPVAGLYQQGRVHHVGLLGVVEGQMTTWVEGDSDSPDRLDALVYAITWLYGEGPVTVDVASPAARERRGRRADQPSSRLPDVYGYRSGRPR